MTEETLSQLLNEVAGSYVVNFHTQNRDDVTMDISPPFLKRISKVSGIKESMPDKLDDANFFNPLIFESS